MSSSLSCESCIPRTDTISFVCALLVELGKCCILASTYKVIRFNELKAVIVRSGYVALNVSILDRSLWVPNFLLSTVGAHDHSQVNEPPLYLLNPL